jgi:HEAT repeat protein
VAATAQLGLGVFARKLWRDDRAKSEALVQSFVRQLEASTELNAQLQWLSVLGNGGTPTGFEPVARHLADPRPVVRSVAISALRWQADPRVNALLIAALRDDADENVRSSAARTLEFRNVDPATFAAFKRALARDPSARLRNVVLVILWQLRADHPEVVALVNATAQADPEQSVRNAAKALLKPTS